MATAGPPVARFSNLFGQADLWDSPDVAMNHTFSGKHGDALSQRLTDHPKIATQRQGKQQKLLFLTPILKLQNCQQNHEEK